MDNLIYNLFLHLVCDTGNRRAITNFFGGKKDAFEASDTQWRFCPLISQREYSRKLATDRECIEKIIQQCRENGWRIVTEDDDDYPAGLKLFSDAPAVLFVWGNATALRGMICVSGTRNMNKSSADICEKTADAVHECARKVLSFDTPGCDSTVMQYALGYGSTCMMLAGGFGAKYENGRLIEQAAHMGAVVTIAPPFKKGNPAMYHVRNRLAARLCDAAIITQTGEKGNSLFVASQFQKIQKPVFAVAGSAGCDKILNEYGYIMRSPLERAIVSHYASTPPVTTAYEPEYENKFTDNSKNNLDNLSQNSIIVFNILKAADGKMNMDELTEKSELELHDLMGAVTELELFGMVQLDTGSICIIE